ncbi:unnamed protein product [Spirodela intermedia]|uniref:Uncharacterized protein n=1 Tax=Spirodela intermedia TaxID=51605 RepID=A0A7I8KGB0_SPIIN|nr:unnamed protein product [Spirodela intermedia]
MARRFCAPAGLLLPFDSSTVFANLLRSCTEFDSLHGVRRVHALLLQTEFSTETFILNRLVDSYARCGSVDDARKLFDRVPHRNVFSWNAMISAYARMGCLEEAEKLFGEMPARDQCSWNSMVSGLAQHGLLEEALVCFSGMHADDFVLNAYSFSSALSACGGLKDCATGMQIHASISKSPLVFDVFMGSALVDMYAKCGKPPEARRVFDSMPDRNVVSWNSLITCYEQNGPVNEALEMFRRMMECEVEPDEVTFASVASACATLLAIREGLQIHSRTVKNEKLRGDLVLGNALVDMYAKCGRVREARYMFDGMAVRNVISVTSMLSGYARSASVEAARSMFTRMTERNIVAWNALIAGYTQNEENEEALKLFRQLKREAFWPTPYTLGNILSACANLANLPLGQQSHAHVLKHGFGSEPAPESITFVGNSLIDLYFKCGAPAEAMRVFATMPARDRVSWNAMIVGLAQNGRAEQALALFSDMAGGGEKPDHVTMIGVLCACSHAGLVEEGKRCFMSMSEQHGLSPARDHYTCMVDLLGRAGRLREAAALVAEMPMEPDSVLLGSLLAACRTHGEVDLGEWAAMRLLELDKGSSGPYVLLSNMYTEVGRWEDALRVRKMMKRRGVAKQPGCSWIGMEEGKVHVFMARDRGHPRRKEIYRVLKALRLHMRIIDPYSDER